MTATKESKPFDVEFLTPGHPGWTDGLTQMESVGAPESLWLIGRPLPWRKETIAIVGTRRPTGAGVAAAKSLATRLTEAGFAIVSGMALGIDTVAHNAALDAGGHTVAVLGCGVDVLYPKSNLRLRNRIAQKGSIASEFPPGTKSHPRNFPQRNRIIAGLARAVVVVEGSVRSGALITARFGVDANRDVFAVPGSHRNPMAAGPNELIRTGQAGLVTSADHLFESFGHSLVWDERAPVREPAPALDSSECDVLFAMDDVGNSTDRVMRITGMDLGKVMLVLSRLEIRGLITKRIGGYEMTEAGARARSLHSPSPLNASRE